MQNIERYFKEDPYFAKEFIQSLQSNLAEFRDSLLATIKHQEHVLFMKTHHKMKTTLSLVGNQKLIDQTEIIITLLTQGGSNAINIRIQNAFCRLCNSTINELATKLEYYKGININNHENISVR